MPGGPKWCELFPILYRIPFLYKKIKLNKTDVVTVGLGSMSLVLNSVVITCLTLVDEYPYITHVKLYA